MYDLVYVHKNKTACINYIADYIREVTKPYETNSRLQVTVNNSSKTKSKYVNVCYPSKEENPFPNKFPYVVRITDHTGTNLFHPDQPDHIIHIEPFFLRPTDQELHSTYVKDYRRIAHKILTAPPSQIPELKQILNNISRKITELNMQAMFRFNYDLVSICSEIIEILESNPK